MEGWMQEHLLNSSIFKGAHLLQHKIDKTKVIEWIRQSCLNKKEDEDLDTAVLTYLLYNQVMDNKILNAQVKRLESELYELKKGLRRLGGEEDEEMP